MEDYIVGIAPRDPIAPDRLSGHVEVVARKEKITFRNIEELIGILIRREKGSDIKFRLE